LKKTITTPNRSTTFIQSWWAKTHLFLFTALLFSCEEDLNLLGFRGDDQRFKVYYTEIPVPSSVLLLDSVRSLNLTTRETNRLLVGSYSDPLLGEVTAKAFSQFRTSDIISFLPADAAFDSAIFQVRFDFYNYGSDGITDLELSIHELTASMPLDEEYFSKTEIPYDPTPLGVINTTINQEYFDDELSDTDSDSLVIVKTKLSQSFGQRLFDAIDPEDENFTNFNLFKNQFKGFAIIPTVSDKIVGISNASNSFLIVYYHYTNDSGTTTTGSRIFTLGSGISFSNITSERSATDLSGLTNYHEDFFPAANRYVQSGVGIATKLDFGGFYDLIDEYPNVIINSAELSIENVADPGTFELPTFGLVMLDENNKFRKMTLTADKDSAEYVSFQNKVILGTFINDDALTAPYAISDVTTLLGLSYSTDDDKFLSFPTLFFQQLYALREKRYPYWALTAINPSSTKTVNRAVFNKDNIKLKVYYTRPNDSEN
jgi:hypothetical protein